MDKHPDLSNQLNFVLESKNNNPFSMISEPVKKGLMSMTSSVSDFLSKVSLRLTSETSSQIPAIYVDDFGVGDYTNVSRIMVPVPRGFKGNIYDYSVFLTEMMTIYSKIDEDILKPAIRVVENMATQKDKLSYSTMVNQFKQFQIRPEAYERYEKEVKTYFVKNGTNEFIKYGAIFRRNAELKQLIEQCDNLRRVHNSRNDHGIVKDIQRLSAACDLLYRRLQSGDMQDLPTNTAGMIATVLGGISREVELYGTVCVLSEQLCQYVINIHHQLKLVLVGNK